MPTTCDIYLRLSDLRNEEALDGREDKLRAEAARLGWTVWRVVIENDVVRGGDGQMRPASAFKRKRMRTPSGRIELRAVRPGFRDVLDDMTSGRIDAMLCEDLDRLARQPRDMEDLLDACELRQGSARSLSGSLTLTDGGTDSERFTARIMVAQANKSSSDTSRRVKEKRQVLSGVSYLGGQRPYGYAVAMDTEKYHRTLIIVPDEAEVLRRSVADVLQRDISLKAIARDLRTRGIPSARDTRWTAASLRYVLLKPSIAGLVKVPVADENGKPVTEDGKPQFMLKIAPWDAIIERDEWELLVAKLTDAGRRTNGNVTTSGHANEPRWLLSKIAYCGLCDDGKTTVQVTGSQPKSYVCGEAYHVRRNVRLLDEYISGLIIKRLSQPDARDLLKPPPKRDVDTSGLHAEAKQLRKRKAAQMRMHSQGLIDDDDLALGMQTIRDRLNAIDAQLVTSCEPDPLAEFRDKPAKVVWESLSLARKRAVVRLLVRVTILPAGRMGRGFDPDTVHVERLH